MTYIKTLLGPLLLVAGLLGAAPAWAQTGPQPRLPTVAITAGMHLIQAEVAQSDSEQAMGMMFRTQMGANEGMLFVNETATSRCFWMRNTLIPLSIAFIDNDGLVSVSHRPCPGGLCGPRTGA